MDGRVSFSLRILSGLCLMLICAMLVGSVTEGLISTKILVLAASGIGCLWLSFLAHQILQAVTMRRENREMRKYLNSQEFQERSASW